MSAVPSTAPSAQRTTLFGKIPARPDFVRYGPFGASAQEFDAWLIRAMERLHSNKATFPSNPTRFACGSSDAANMLIGVLAPSNDKIGRSFPVAIFHTTPLPAVLESYAAIPDAYRPFFDQVERLITDLPNRSHPEIEASLLELQAPSADTLSASQAACHGRLQSSAASEFLEAAFGPAAAGKHLYGLLTLLRAADIMRTQPATRVPLLQCPTSNIVGIETWLEILRRLGPSRTASFFWNERDAVSLLFRWGAPSDDLLCALADPNYGSSAVWPLSTEREAAITQARTALAGPLSELAPGASAAGLIALLVGMKL